MLLICPLLFMSYQTRLPKLSVSAIRRIHVGILFTRVSQGNRCGRAGRFIRVTVVSVIQRTALAGELIALAGKVNET